MRNEEKEEQKFNTNSFPELPEEDTKLQSIFERLREGIDEELLRKIEKEVDDEILQDDVDENEKRKEFKKIKR